MCVQSLNCQQYICESVPVHSFRHSRSRRIHPVSSCKCSFSYLSIETIGLIEMDIIACIFGYNCISAHCWECIVCKCVFVVSVVVGVCVILLAKHESRSRLECGNSTGNSNCNSNIIGKAYFEINIHLVVLYLYCERTSNLHYLS